MNSTFKMFLTMTIKTLESMFGTLSAPSKMPGFGTSIPAAKCKVGGALHKIKGSTCEKCYARKGRYIFPNVIAAMTKRLNAISRPDWALGMAALISKKYRRIADPANRVFRWHDSGDLQSASHLVKIVGVVSMTGDIRHWLPTREYWTVDQVFPDGPDAVPGNLNIRLSAPMVGPIPEPGETDAFATVNPCNRIQQKFHAMQAKGWPVSTVGDDSNPDSFQCPAYKQDGQCLTCRACWDANIPCVNYPLH